MGYSVRRLAPIWRVFYGVTGICLLLPVGVMAQGRWINLAGAGLVVLLFFWERARKRRPAIAA
jgi:hypothetical protein